MNKIYLIIAGFLSAIAAIALVIHFSHIPVDSIEKEFNDWK